MDMTPPIEPGDESPGGSDLEGLPLRKIAGIAGAIVVVAAVGTWMALRSHSPSGPRPVATPSAAVAPTAQRPAAMPTAQYPAAMPARAEPRKSAAEATLARA